jgi:quercetin dioxygenase-like cupin family protein
MAELPQRVTRDIELDIQLPATKAVGRVEVRRIRMPAGTPAGAHVHNGPVFGTILRGRVLYQLHGDERRMLSSGDVFYEPEGARVLHFDALDDDVEFTAVFPVAPGQNPDMTFL